MPRPHTVTGCGPSSHFRCESVPLGSEPWTSTGTGRGAVVLDDTDGRLRLMAASDERAQMLELFQVQGRHRA